MCIAPEKIIFSRKETMLLWDMGTRLSTDISDIDKDKSERKENFMAVINWEEAGRLGYWDTADLEDGDVQRIWFLH